MRLPPHALQRVSTPDPQQQAWLNGQLQQIINQVYSVGGQHAFEATERTAAYHEAGHAVMYGLAGIPVQQVWIKGIKINGSLTWVGECVADISWQVSGDSAVAQDLLFARILLAGWLAEYLFVVEDLRKGSSIDEVLLASAICATAAHKAGYAYEQMFCEAVEIAISALCLHERDVRRIAGTLVRCRRLCGARLSRLLPGAKARHAE
jgi:hypothetical protein